MLRFTDAKLQNPVQRLSVFDNLWVNSGFSLEFPVRLCKDTLDAPKMKRHKFSTNIYTTFNLGIQAAVVKGNKKTHTEFPQCGCKNIQKKSDILLCSPYKKTM